MRATLVVGTVLTQKIRSSSDRPARNLLARTRPQLATKPPLSQLMAF
jgi:hypothetical protein